MSFRDNEKNFPLDSPNENDDFKKTFIMRAKRKMRAAEL